MASSSSSSGASVFAVNLYDTNFSLVAVVDIIMPMPNLLAYQGKNYVWSNVHWGYMQTTAYNAVLDAGAPSLSVLSWPQQ